MPGLGRHYVRVQGTLIQFRQPFSATRGTNRPPTHIVLDVSTPEGAVVRVVFKQHLTGDIKDPSPGDVVPVDWDATHHQARLALQGDERYDRRFARKQRKAALEAAGTPEAEAETS
jgi:hypothetical protein